MNKREYIEIRKTLEILAEKKKIEFEKDLKTAVDKKYNSGFGEKFMDYDQVMNQEEKSFQNSYKNFLKGINSSLEKIAELGNFKFKPIKVNLYSQKSLEKTSSPKNH